MSREKQISEMTKDLCEIQCNGMKCAACDTSCEWRMLAEALYNAGYRKASDLAEEILAAISAELNLQAIIVCKTRGKYRETDKPSLSFIAELDGRIYSLRVVEDFIAELKKKYTEEGK